MDLPSQSPSPEHAPVDNVQVLQSQLRKFFPEDLTETASVTLFVMGHPKNVLNIGYEPTTQTFAFWHHDERSRGSCFPEAPYMDSLKGGKFASSDTIEAMNVGSPDLADKIHGHNELVAEMFSELIRDSHDRSAGPLGRMLLRFARKEQ